MYDSKKHMLCKTFMTCYIQCDITHDSKKHNILYITATWQYRPERQLHNMLYSMFFDVLYCRRISHSNPSVY